MCCDKDFFGKLRFLHAFTRCPEDPPKRFGVVKCNFSVFYVVIGSPPLVFVEMLSDQWYSPRCAVVAAAAAASAQARKPIVKRSLYRRIQS
jgi:hypothetical protein